LQGGAFLQIKKECFGYLTDGRAVTRYVLERDGMRLGVLDFGAAIQQLLLPNASGGHTDVVCGFDRAEFYNADTYQGVVVGRFANRIAHGRFSLDGKEHYLSKSEGTHFLHGGFCGFQRRFWQVTAQNEAQASITLSLHSPDGDEGFPGALDVSVVYQLLADHTLSVRFLAQTDKPTVVNLINHVAFQLGGLAEENVREHVLWLDADAYLPVRELIPTGEIRSVEGTIFDFRTPKQIGRDLDDPQLRDTKGFDVCLRFAGRLGGLLHRATLTHKKSGREMRLYTDLPAVQLYCGNYYGDPGRPFKGGIPQRIHHGVCLEAGMMPDSPNHSNFTNTTLRPGEVFDHRILYRFTAEK
jgi:aldose 1-epimerase